MTPALLQNRAAAEYVARGLRTWIRDLAASRVGPEPVRFAASNMDLWRRTDLDDWLTNAKAGGELRTRSEWRAFRKTRQACETAS